MIARRLRTLRPLLLALGALLIAPTVAFAAAVPGATYAGTASDGATITLTVASSGTSVSFYRVLGIFGTDANGAQCQGTAEEDQDAWNGAPIANDSFAFSLPSSFSISGTFGGSQSVSGTFDLDQPAQGGSAGCSTGDVTWSATTTSTTGSGGSTGGGTGGTNGGSITSGATSTGSAAKKSFAVRVSFRRRAQVKLLGSLKSSVAKCTARRMVYLWAGRRRLSSARATTKGAFTFKVRKVWRARRVHTSVLELRASAGTCKAASSITIRG